MLHKIIDNFDIDTYGWFEPKAKESYDSNFILDHCSDIWSLWVKQETIFRFTNHYSPENTLSLGMRSWNFQNSPFFHNDFDRLWPDKERFMSLVRTYISREHSIFIDSTVPHTALNPALDPANPKTITEQHKPRILVPSNFINKDVATRVGDIYLLSDACAAYGLEESERLTQLINGLDFTNFIELGPIYNHYHLPPSNNLRDPKSIIAACTLDIHNAAVTRAVRTTILSKWPGWEELFTAKDTVCLGDQPTMQSTVSRKSKARCELRRFCIALAWNLNAPHDSRVDFPSKFKTQYKFAIDYWQTHIVPHLSTPGRLITPLHELVNRLALTLNTDEEADSRSRTPINGSDFTKVDPNTLDKSPIRSRRNHTTQEETVKPRALPTEESNNLDVPPPAAIYNPCDWSQQPRSYRNYPAISQNFMDKVRPDVAERISAASWFVPQPPPLDPGHLNGQLDEAALTDLVAFNDPAVFLSSPDMGRGQIAVCVLIDASGSMSNQYSQDVPADPPEYPNQTVCVVEPQCRMQETMAFLGGLKDGLARHSNVSLMPFTYNSCVPHKRSENVEPWLCPPDYINYSDSQTFAVCAMIPVTSEEDMLKLAPSGGTPTATAIHNAEQLLQAHHPNSAHMIIVLTDGAPCGSVTNPFREFKEDDTFYDFHESTEAVHKVVKSISTPVFCVAYGDCSEDLLKKQYNPDHHFVVDRPLDAVEVACNLITGIGQSISR
jgi:hypothetical protein